MRRPACLRALAAFGFLGVCLWLAPARSAPPAAGKWYKGNLHTHTLNSDGDSSPDTVARWYREHRYDFLVLTDHNYLSPVDGLNAVIGAPEKFLVVRGEEVTARFESKPVHINAFHPRALIPPQVGLTLVETIQRNVDAIRQGGGMPSINHPNFGWALTADDLRQVENNHMFELYNGHPTVNNVGGGGSAGLEEMWDILLTGGRRMYGIAVDDAHYFQQWGPQFSNPGRGWVAVRAAEMSAEALVEALGRGDFYASTGVALREAAREGNTLRVEIQAAPALKYTTEFIGANGRVLATSFETASSYTLAVGDRYVRARVRASSGDLAWTQPLFR